MNDKISRILITEEKIKEIIKNLAGRINEDYEGKEIILMIILTLLSPWMITE